MWRCLEDNLWSKSMTADCRLKIRQHVALKNSNYGLNPAITQNCGDDLEFLCEDFWREIIPSPSIHPVKYCARCHSPRESTKHAHTHTFKLLRGVDNSEEQWEVHHQTPHPIAALSNRTSSTNLHVGVRADARANAARPVCVCSMFFLNTNIDILGVTIQKKTVKHNIWVFTCKQ